MFRANTSNKQASILGKLQAVYKANLYMTEIHSNQFITEPQFDAT